VKTHKDLWLQVVSAENMLAAAKEAMRGKRPRKPPPGYSGMFVPDGEV